MEKLIITTALTGNVPTKKMNPSLPVTPEEIARDVKACAEAGSALFHVHARDTEEKPSLDPEIFKEIVRQIKKTSPDVIVQLSTGARAGKDWEDRAFPVRLLPEMGSFTTGSNNLPGIIYENSPQFIEFLAKVFQETGVKPEIEVFDKGMIDTALRMAARGIIRSPMHFDFVMGVQIAATARDLAYMVHSIPENATWTVAGIGRHQIPMAVLAIVMGGHARVGFEDNIYLSKGIPAKSNGELVGKVAHISEELGRPIASPARARDILGLPPLVFA